MRTHFSAKQKLWHKRLTPSKKRRHKDSESQWEGHTLIIRDLLGKVQVEKQAQKRNR